MKLKFWGVISLLILALGLAACGDNPTATPAPSLAPITTVAVPPAAQITTVAPVMATLPNRPPTSSTANSATTAASGNLAKGLTLFVQSCGGCHGGEKAVGRNGPPLNNITFPYEGLLRQVRSGSGIMPAFPATALPDADVKLIYDYLQSLKK